RPCARAEAASVDRVGTPSQTSGGLPRYREHLAEDSTSLDRMVRSRQQRSLRRDCLAGSRLWILRRLGPPPARLLSLVNNEPKIPGSCFAFADPRSILGRQGSHHPCVQTSLERGWHAGHSALAREFESAFLGLWPEE